MTEVIAACQPTRPPTLVALGRRLGRSPWHLNVIFQRSTGITIYEFTTCVRMLLAARAINTGVKIEALALELGYRSAKTFYRRFEEFSGMTPAAYRDHPGSARLALPSERFFTALLDRCLPRPGVSDPLCHTTGV